MVTRLFAGRQRAAARPAPAAQRRPVPPRAPAAPQRDGWEPPRPLQPPPGFFSWKLERLIAQASGVPPRPPRPSFPPRPPRVMPLDAPERRWLEVAWLACQMPEHLREPARGLLLQTLEQRETLGCLPLKAPKQQRTLFALTRFGQNGEQLRPKGDWTLRRKLRMEVREGIRIVEGKQWCHLERNHLLAMRGARLGQLCAEVEARGQDVVNVLRWELSAF